MHEPDVTLTDYLLALEGVVFAVLLWWRRRGGRGDHSLAGWFGLLFGAFAVAAATGGTVHGFFPDEGSAGYHLLWPASLLAVGVSGLAGWGAGAALLFPAGDPVRRAIVGAASLLFLGYAGIVAAVSQAWSVAIAHYLPGAVFLLGAFSARWVRARGGRDRRGARAAAWGVGGMASTFVAAALQQLGVALHPTYFDHNALYHLVQFVAMAMLFVGACQSRSSEGRGGSATAGGKAPDQRDIS